MKRPNYLYNKNEVKAINKKTRVYGRIKGETT